MLRYQLTRAFAFRRIDHPHMRWIVTILPILIAVACTVITMLLPIRPRIFGGDGFNQNVLSLTSTLPGFYIAALAAVATFSQDSLDTIMQSPAPKIKLASGGKLASAEMTMRMFLSHLFAYLAMVSFLLIFFSILSKMVAPSVLYWLSLLGDYHKSAIIVLEISYFSTMFWLIGNILVVTLFGMYFLAERIHRPSA